MVVAEEEYCIVPLGGDESLPPAGRAFKNLSFEDLATSALGPFSTRSETCSEEHTPSRVVGTTRCVAAPDDLAVPHEAGSCFYPEIFALTKHPRLSSRCASLCVPTLRS